MSQMHEFEPSNKDVIIDGSLGVLGLIPGIGTAASLASLAKTGKEAKNVYDYKNSWMAFVMKYPKK